MKYVWLGENTRKEESHKLSKEEKAGICYLNPPNEINNFFKNNQGGQYPGFQRIFFSDRYDISRRSRVNEAE